MLQVIKITLLSLVLLYAGLVDIKTQLVPTRIHFMLFGIGCINFTPQAITGLSMTFIPLFLIYLFAEYIKAGDIKLCSSCAFVVQGSAGVEGAVLGLLLGGLILPILKRVQHKPLNDWTPVVPFFAVGYIAVGILTLR